MSASDENRSQDNEPDLPGLSTRIRKWANELGFEGVGVTNTDLRADENHLGRWLARGFHGDMAYMQRHGTKRSRPAELVPGTVRIVTVRMNYLPRGAADMRQSLADPNLAYVARYALGRDYHKVVRRRLQTLADRITAEIGRFGYRAFCDSAPVLERALARKAGMGWIGKHTNLIDRSAGSWFFLGELYTDLPLPVDSPASAHCGTCTACFDACPTGAIIGDRVLDARRCIAYLTIEHPGSIPLQIRPLMRNRIFGCDDCQLVCPWNRDAPYSRHSGFEPRHELDRADLLTLFRWGESTFRAKTEGSPIRRIGFERWSRNLSVALGNALRAVSKRACERRAEPPEESYAARISQALQARRDDRSALVREHVRWATDQEDPL